MKLSKNNKNVKKQKHKILFINKFIINKTKTNITNQWSIKNFFHVFVGIWLYTVRAKGHLGRST